MVDYDERADRISDELLRLMDRMRREQSSWTTSRQWRNAVMEYHDLYAQFKRAVADAKFALDDAERNFHIPLGKMAAEFYRRQNAEPVR